MFADLAGDLADLNMKKRILKSVQINYDNCGERIRGGSRQVCFVLLITGSLGISHNYIDVYTFLYKFTPPSPDIPNLAGQALNHRVLVAVIIFRKTPNIF